MTTMHDIYDQDLGGPQHKADSDCKAPEMTDKMWAILQGTAGAKDTCVLTAIMNVLAHSYATRFEKRGVTLENFLESIRVSVSSQVVQAEMIAMLKTMCKPHHNHLM